jgi:putative membrane protein
VPDRSNDGEWQAAIVSAAAVAVSGLLVLLAHDLGPHATHMALHIAAMSLLAPVTAALSAYRMPGWLCGTSALWSSAAAQLALLWVWHVPGVQRLASESHALHAAALALLFICAFVFWVAVIRAASAARWHVVAALMVTGKLTCLLGVLLTFSPRALYVASSHAGHRLDDQQLAGLLMTTAATR